MDSAHEKEFYIIQFAKTNTETGVQHGVLNTTGRTHQEKTGFATIFQGCGLNEPDFGSWEKSFFFFQSVQTDFVAYPASCSMGNRASPPGVKQPEREADHSA
jgi:hypothetical protein